jgi:DNA modification methylase
MSFYHIDDIPADLKEFFEPAPQLGLEATPDAYVARMVEVFREVRRVLKSTGTCWLNLGDSYAGSWGNYGGQNRGNGTQRTRTAGSQVPNPAYDNLEDFRPPTASVSGLKPKDLVGIPWRVAFALQADGWYLRQDIIWAKPNPMPESVTDRCTKAHEYIFLLSKSARYFYDAEAVKEPALQPVGAAMLTGQKKRASASAGPRYQSNLQSSSLGSNQGDSTRNRRSVWTVATRPFSGAKLVADYVGDDGKPYKASPDCPIHGPMLSSGKFDKAANGGRTVRLKHDSLGSDADLFSWREPSPDATISRSPSEEADANARGQTPESTGESKSNAPLREYTLPDGNPHRNGRMSEPCASPCCSAGSTAPPCSLSAIDHNRQTNRTDPADQTSQRDTACAQTRGRTPDTKPSGGSSAPRPDTRGSTEQGSDSGDSRLTETASRTGGKQKISSGSCDEKYCTCGVVSIDHFATFPPKLVEPCILAGCPEGGTVLDPFAGSGTTLAVAMEHGRNAIGIELNAEYIDLARRRLGEAKEAAGLRAVAWELSSTPLTGAKL